MNPHEAPKNRRETLLRLLRLGGVGGATAGAAVWLGRQNHPPREPAAVSIKPNFTVPERSDLPEMAVVRGEDPASITRRAIEVLGGISRFVVPGDVVVVKPNVAWDRTPEQAANSNPQVIAEICRLCRGAGARRVIVTDVTINEPRRCFARSGIGEAAQAAGAEVILPAPRLFREVDLGGEILSAWPVLDPFFTATKMINVPVAKHHSLTGASLGMKNWYGILGGSRHRLHQRIHESLADLAAFMRPTLTILDAYRVLLRNGPGGGNPADVALKKTLIAGTDPVAVDAYAAQTFWNLDWHTLRYLKLASERQLGKLHLDPLRTRFIDT